MEDQNNCPKPNCGRPESTHRWSAGKKLSICGNGHHWDAQEVAAQRAKAKEAERQEFKIEIEATGIDRLRREMEEFRRRVQGGPFT